MGLFKAPSYLLLSAFASTAIFLIGCSTQESATPALFDTKAAAEKAAKKFNCTGAHQMGDKWMPCKAHQQIEEHKTYDAEHHHQDH